MVKGFFCWIITCIIFGFCIAAAISGSENSAERSGIPPPPIPGMPPIPPIPGIPTVREQIQK